MSKFLYVNDTAATYPPSWYAESLHDVQRRLSLNESQNCDVCVIGGGFTGLSTALHLAKKGLKVIVLEAHRVGFGASGRNGGQVGSGWNQDQRKLEKQLGYDAAHRLWEMTQDAKVLTRSLADSFAPDAGYHAGVAQACFSEKDTLNSHNVAQYLEKNYAYTEIELLSKASITDIIKSSVYSGGTLDWGAGHLHPLRFAIGLAKAAEEAGAIIFEASPVVDIKNKSPNLIKTDLGQVTAEYVVHATNGYHSNLNQIQSAHVMPINNYLVATAPLDNPHEILAKNIAVADSRFVLNYYRLTNDNRLIFGGGESYGVKFPRDIFSKVRKPLTEIFPQLENVDLTHAWGGTLGITTTRLPMFAKVGRKQLAAAGYSGHGVALASFAGQVLAETISGNSSQFDLLSDLPHPAFPGGQTFRSPIMTLAMTWFSLRDRLGI